MLRHNIEQQTTQALKQGDRELLETLRFLMASIKNSEIDLKREATDEEIMAIIQRQVKQHRESIDAYTKAGRTDLQEKEEKQLLILQQFLPTQLSEEELRTKVLEIVNQVPQDQRDFGRLMGLVMAQVKGKAEGGKVSQLIKQALES